MVLIKVNFDKGRYHLVTKMEEWCHQRIGPGGWVYPDPDDWCTRRWAVSATFGNTVFYFKNQVDATVFALRWQ